jgi:hypothetical protein
VDLDQPQAPKRACDPIIDATGAVELSVGMLGALAPNGVLDLVGGPPEHKAVPMRASLLGAMVGRNLTLLGSVNANTQDWIAAVRDLTEMRHAFPAVVEALITHRFSMEAADVAFERVPGQIKAIVTVASRPRSGGRPDAGWGRRAARLSGRPGKYRELLTEQEILGDERFVVTHGRAGLASR